MLACVVDLRAMPNSCKVTTTICMSGLAYVWCQQGAKGHEVNYGVVSKGPSRCLLQGNTTLLIA